MPTILGHNYIKEVNVDFSKVAVSWGLVSVCELTVFIIHFYMSRKGMGVGSGRSLLMSSCIKILARIHPHRLKMHQKAFSSPALL